MKHLLRNRIKAAVVATCLLGAGALASPAQAADDDQMSGIHAGDVLVRLRAISIMPNVGTNQSLSALNVGVNNAIVPELDLTYMIRDYLGVELILGTSRHQLTSSLGNLGGVNVLPPTLLLQYHFNHAGRIRPYVGAGLNYTLFYNNGLNAGGQPISITNHSFGPALQAGVDVQVTKSLFVNADIKKIWMHTDATLGGQSLGRLDIDPVVVGLGVGMRF
ncbi:OmpW/AlkL family protein [Paraburkholderia nemoris]|uniref:Outer membrane protein W n=1 Tax=Paraburkholderia nemoris TaxID=2793076 RepID=A0ABN7LFX0_9BURK|nr:MULTISPECIES: OmpW family outer membrane protein [Paraburkholderia]MBK3741359.1 OmpW family protein [Paraburkholderia aspalathi]MBK3811040.1 OmpW family protein [Paraburkholderia aspalathi]CAE6744835.1 Outer membrane protein W [Paraburkholderia nemoris]CAE6750784.1 Outer membrane protein W [Paraburkholderia nemoris]CAE6800528.1 Outer membrane protein W [Paraburkholderia nemoris]